jgi:hypothetical protein
MLLDLKGYIRAKFLKLPLGGLHGKHTVEEEVEVNLRPTVSRPVCLGVRRPSGTFDQFFFLLEISFQTSACLLFCSALSDERMGL